MTFSKTFSDKKKILKEAREKKNIMCKGTPIWLSADFLAETGPESGITYLKCWKIKIANQKYFIQQSYLSAMKEK